MLENVFHFARYKGQQNIGGFSIFYNFVELRFQEYPIDWIIKEIQNALKGHMKLYQKTLSITSDLPK